MYLSIKLTFVLYIYKYSHIYLLILVGDYRGDFLLSRTVQRGPNLSAVRAQVLEEFLEILEDYILDGGDMPTDMDAVRLFVRFLISSLDPDQILDIACRFLANPEFSTSKTARVVQLIRDNIDNSAIVQRAIDFASHLEERDDCSFNAEDHRARCAFTNRLAWAIPSRPAVTAICEFAGSDLILEVCAGLALWAALIRGSGGNIVATDSFTSHGTSPEKAFLDVVHMDAVSAVLAYPDSQVLFLCWPGCAEPFAANALEEFQGDRVVFIGEDRWGCTADDRFFDLLAQFWEEVDFINLKHWPGIHDALFLYRRKTVEVEVNASWDSVDEEDESLDSAVEDDSWTLVQPKNKAQTKNTASALQTYTSSNRYSVLYDSDEEC